MRLPNIYLILCVLGAFLPYSAFSLFLLEEGLDLQLFFEQLFENNISAFFALDAIISAVVLVIFIFSEGQRLEMEQFRVWLPIIATFAVGASLGLPLFLYMREFHIESQSKIK